MTRGSGMGLRVCISHQLGKPDDANAVSLWAPGTVRALSHGSLPWPHWTKPGPFPCQADRNIQEWAQGPMLYLAGSPADPQVQMRLGTTLPSVLSGWSNKHSCPRRPRDYACGAQAPPAPRNFTGDKQTGEPWPLGLARLLLYSPWCLSHQPAPDYRPLSPVVWEKRAHSHTHLPNKAPESSRVSDWPTRFEDVLQP